jgi:hypothetical protein
MVSVVAPNGIKIVVFTGDTQAFLRIDRPGIRAGFRAQKDVFELHHASVGEKQGAVAARHKRCARDYRVPPLGKKVEERLTNLISA